MLAPSPQAEQLSPDQLRSLFADFNAAYAARYPNLRLEVVEVHELSVAREDSIGIIGDYPPEKAAERMLKDPRLWVSRKRHVPIIANSTAEPATTTAIRIYRGLVHGTNCKRLRRSMRAFLRKRSPHATFDRSLWEVVHGKRIERQHRFDFSDGKFAIGTSLETMLKLVSPDRALVKHQVIHTIHDKA